MVFGRDKSKAKRRRRKKTGLTGPPFQVQVFGRYLTSWREMGRTIFARPKRGLLFTSLIFQQRTWGFLDTKYETTAIYEAVKPQDMTERAMELYRRTKNMECLLARRGALRKELFFKPSPVLEDLRKLIPAIAPSEELAQALNQDEELMELLHEVRPDDMSIALHSVPAQYQPFSRSKEALLQGMIEFYEKPTVIAWIITIVNVLSRGPGIKGKADMIISVLQRTAEALEAKTKEIDASLAQADTSEKTAPEPSSTAETVTPQA